MSLCKPQSFAQKGRLSGQTGRRRCGCRPVAGGLHGKLVAACVHRLEFHAGLGPELELLAQLVDVLLDRALDDAGVCAPHGRCDLLTRQERTRRGEQQPCRRKFPRCHANGDAVERCRPGQPAQAIRPYHDVHAGVRAHRRGAAQGPLHAGLQLFGSEVARQHVVHARIEGRGHVAAICKLAEHQRGPPHVGIALTPRKHELPGGTVVLRVDHQHVKRFCAARTQQRQGVVKADAFRTLAGQAACHVGKAGWVGGQYGELHGASPSSHCAEDSLQMAPETGAKHNVHNLLTHPYKE
ncbi:hypothetical protein COLO4_00895 [Corchorus olitorius]|uniref:Uncharacterized protein n=1 Tax=Corchorus olitorius TaxID=93759 RepID=A0A1R3L395_9ROSI|nr:hypothetical protein COLO4_00895 [Corchorus olitorius]